MPGQIWAEGGDLEPVETPEHLRAAYLYILTKQSPDAWTWCHKRGVLNNPG